MSSVKESPDPLPESVAIPDPSPSSMPDKKVRLEIDIVLISTVSSNVNTRTSELKLK